MHDPLPLDPPRPRTAGHRQKHCDNLVAVSCLLLSVSMASRGPHSATRGPIDLVSSETASLSVHGSDQSKGHSLSSQTQNVPWDTATFPSGNGPSCPECVEETDSCSCAILASVSFTLPYHICLDAPTSSDTNCPRNGF